MKRHLGFTFLLGTGIGLAGCQSPMLGGLPSWTRGDSSASTAPDVSKQKFNGLSQQLGSSQSPSVGMGGNRQPESTGFLASWKKSSAATSAAITGAMTAKPKMNLPDDDPLRLDRMPKNIGPEVYIGAARLFENQGKFAEAEDKYREALKAAPNDLNGLVGLARLYDRQGQPQKAIEVYQKAAQVHPQNSLVHNDLGLCYRRQRQVDKSIATFQKAVEHTPGNAKYRNNLAAALVDGGRESEAYQQLTAVNSPAVAHYNLAYLLNEKGQRANAVRHLQEAVAADPSLRPANEMLTQLGAGAPQQAAQAQQAAPPQQEAFVASEPPSYHIGDDSAPAIQTAQRSTWAETSATATPPAGVSYTQPLPPVE
jgi:tetratricopeptide (TPR) repeat protein